MSQHLDGSNNHYSLQINLNIKEDDAYDKEELGITSDIQSNVPTICGIPLKYLSLVTLAVQNATLTLIMHYSRVSTPPSQTYSAAAAVLLTEILKGSISLFVAFTRIDVPIQYPGLAPASSSQWSPSALFNRSRRLLREVFRPDCWKLSIPAILYVIQNNLQFVAVSNLDAATFQVSYQMKILTTAAFSVLLLRKKLTSVKWLALLFLALGVGIVQIQPTSSHSITSFHHDMNPAKGLVAVVAACFTSGLAGVYFEMVLKNSQADLWVRNVQLSLFSILPALAAIMYSGLGTVGDPPNWFGANIFANFTVWAWATVLTQVLGGLLTALVIKYADNILKGFATSLSIVISFMASVALFNFHMTITFVLGSAIVLVATWMYNQPDVTPSTSVAPNRQARSWSWHWRNSAVTLPHSVSAELAGTTLSRRTSSSSLSTLVSSFPAHGASKSYPPSPTPRNLPPLSHQLLDKLVPGRPGRLFGFSPLKGIRALGDRAGLAQSATPSGASASEHSYTYQPLFLSSSNTSQPTADSASCPLSRPASAMSSFPPSISQAGTTPPDRSEP